MSPTSTPADSWISDFEDMLVPASTSSGSFSDLGLSTTASGTSGGGNDGEYDGGTKRSHLFSFSSALPCSGTICLGVVGMGGCRFCIKKTIACTAKSHANKFSPAPNTFYLKGNDTCAHTQPCLSVALVPPNEMPVIQASKHSIDEWTGIFACYTESKSPAKEGLRPAELFNKVPLKTPAKQANASSAESDIMVYSPRGIRQLISDGSGQ
jgi:hypothetical protein